jgi:TRAP-type C4-dicarboxylate transport system substrate-binding protein
MVRLFAAALGSAFVFAAASNPAAAQQELRLLNAFDQRYPPTKALVEKYADTIKAKTGGKITFRISGPEVVNAFQQMQPATSGAFDMWFTVQPYHVGTTSVSFGIYAIDPDPVKFRQLGVFDYLAKEYDRFNLKLLAIIPGQSAGVGAYQVMLRDPVGPDGDLKGRRLRGNPLFLAFIQSLGGSMVNLQVGEVYSTIQKGTIDGATGPVTGATDLKWHEVAKYAVRPTFGYIYQFLFIHKSAYAKLAPEVQKIIVDEAAALEVPGMKAMDDIQKREEEALMKAGAVPSQLNPQKFAAAVKAFNDGVWETTLNSKATGERAKEFEAFVKSKGLFK